MAFILAQSGKAAYNGKTYSMTNFTTSNFWYDRVMEKNSFYGNRVVAPHYTYTIAPFNVLWPVPANAINANSLGQINQTPGYPGVENNVAPWVWKDGEGEGEVVPQ